MGLLSCSQVMPKVCPTLLCPPGTGCGSRAASSPGLELRTLGTGRSNESLRLSGHSSSFLRVGFGNFPRCQHEGRQLPAYPRCTHRILHHRGGFKKPLNHHQHKLWGGGGVGILAPASVSTTVYLISSFCCVVLVWLGRLPWAEGERKVQRKP